jgi:hypothetical protein
MEALLAEERARLQAELSAVRQAAAQQSDEQLSAARARSRAAVERLLDEAETRRRLIDQQLRDAGWEADSEELRFGKGVRPERGRNLAIAEWPTATGPADYVRFSGLTPLGVVEAKRQATNVADRAGQALQPRLHSTGRRCLSGRPLGRLPHPFSLLHERPRVPGADRGAERRLVPGRPPAHQPPAPAAGVVQPGWVEGAPEAGRSGRGGGAAGDPHRPAAAARLPARRGGSGGGRTAGRAAGRAGGDGDRHREDAHRCRDALPAAACGVLPPHPLPGGPQRAGRAGGGQL